MCGAVCVCTRERRARTRYSSFLHNFYCNFFINTTTPADHHGVTFLKNTLRTCAREYINANTTTYMTEKKM